MVGKGGRKTRAEWLRGVPTLPSAPVWGSRSAGGPALSLQAGAGIAVFCFHVWVGVKGHLLGMAMWVEGVGRQALRVGLPGASLGGASCPRCSSRCWSFPPWHAGWMR